MTLNVEVDWYGQGRGFDFVAEISPLQSSGNHFVMPFMVEFSNLFEQSQTCKH